MDKYVEVVPLRNPGECEFDLIRTAQIDGQARKWLTTLRSDWQFVDFLGVRKSDRDMLTRLTLCGLVEQKFILAVILEKGVTENIVCTVSGSYRKKIDGVLDQRYPTWDEWSIPSEREVRLTHEGLIAQEDILSGEEALESHVFGFLRGFTPFTGCHIEEGTMIIAGSPGLDATCSPLPKVDEQSVGGKEGPKKKNRDEWVAKALITKKTNPDWTDRKVAAAADIHPSQLSRCDEYQALKKMMYSRSGIPSGQKNTGNDAPHMEAWEE